MKHLGSLTGTGTVDVKGVAAGNIEYSIDVWLDERNQKMSAGGSAKGDMNAFNKAFNAGGGNSIWKAAALSTSLLQSSASTVPN